MQNSKVIVQIFIIVSFFIGNICPHAGMTYPRPRPTLKDGVPDDFSNLGRIHSKASSTKGHVINKNFPCGNPQPNRDKFQLEKGKTLPVEFKVNNYHTGGTCQFSISYDDAKTFVAFHQVVNDCFAAMQRSGNTTINVPIPNDLPGGNAIFAWTWITKKSNQPEYYMGCSDVTIDGPKVGKLTGYPLIVTSIEFTSEYLGIYSGDPEYSFLFQKKPELVMSVDGNKIELNNKAFTPTRHLKKNDPLFAEFKKTTSSTAINNTPAGQAKDSTQKEKKQEKGTKETGNWNNISPQEIDTKLKYSYNMGDRPKKSN
ncbi:hypothetical protein HMI54_013654 [Coelomomyces lativittatus]|nr:hypothetical protein HMI56_001196 [Coelomomyces lativittatus]KAJ1511160.1 hypothetical protein HMI55_006706 [Coelomomyces lativittatus]KAJ1514729.1 hypothetical protein HMI54_013654 [Coelomomyces lativittatus]